MDVSTKDRGTRILQRWRAPARDTNTIHVPATGIRSGLGMSDNHRRGHNPRIKMGKMGNEVYEVHDHAKLNIYVHARGGVLARRGPR